MITVTCMYVYLYLYMYIRITLYFTSLPLYMLQFPPAFATGNIVDTDDDFQLANHVFNTLQEHSYKEEKYAQQLHEKIKEHILHTREGSRCQDTSDAVRDGRL